MVLVSLLLGGLMIFGATLASASSTTGYDVYKTAFKNIRTATSMTVNSEVSVNDNGNSIIKVNSATKMNQANKSMSSLISTIIGNETSTVNIYRQDGQNIIKSSDSEVYQVMPGHPGPKHDNENDAEFKAEEKYAQDIENLVDAVVGNMRSMVVLDKQADGSKNISLQLSGNQIPPVANALASLLVKTATEQNFGKHNELSELGVDPIANLPKLVEEISITDVNLKAVVNDKEQIVSQQAIFTITGKDAAANTHTVIVQANMNLSDINQTTPDKVDLTGKQIKTLQKGDMHEFED